MLLSSHHNPHIRQLLLLQQKASERRATGCFVVEGLREIMHCANNGHDIQQLFTCTTLLEKMPEAQRIAASVQSRQHYELTPALYQKVAYRDNTEGIIAIVEKRDVRRKAMQKAHLLH